MQRLALMIVIVVASLTSCRGSEPTAPKVPPTHASPDMQFDCQMLATDCEKILNGINHLRAHYSQTCRDIGASAAGRYYAPNGEGFNYRDQIAGADMGVDMQEMGGYTSGMGPTTGYIGVMPSFWEKPESNDPRLTGGLIAHEEGGHMTGQDDIYHNTGMSNWYQTTCSMEN